MRITAPQDLSEASLPSASRQIAGRHEGPKGGKGGGLQPASVGHPRVCGHSSDGDRRSDEVNHRAVAAVGLLAARRYSAKLLELTEEVFDQMAPFVHRSRNR
jgi:hypothetical protein